MAVNDESSCCRYSTIKDLMLLLKQLRCNDPTVTHVSINCIKLPTAYLNAFFSLLAASKVVTHIRLFKCGVTFEVAETLTAFVRCNKSVIDLDLSRNQISDSELEQLVTALLMHSPRDEQTLRRLVLEGNPLTECGIQFLSSAIPKTNIQILKLGKIALGDVGAHSLSVMLRQSTCSIRKLDLRSCNLGTDGASSLANALRTNNSLESLCLGRNNIGDSVVMEIVSALRTKVVLRILDLQYNPITNVGAAEFVRCIDEYNYSLRKVKLRHCVGVSEAMKEVLFDILLVNSFGPELAKRTKQAIRGLLSEECSSRDDSETSFSLTSSNVYDDSCTTDHFQSGELLDFVRPSVNSAGGNEDCIICYDKSADCILLPCKHRNCCISCAEKINSCHMCREIIVKVFPTRGNKRRGLCRPMRTLEQT